MIVIACAGCASPPSNVASAWHHYQSVKVGMTIQKVHAVIGSPPQRELIVGGPYLVEYWVTGDLSRPDVDGASIRVFYDGGPEDGRVRNLVRSLHRSDIVETRP